MARDVILLGEVAARGATMIDIGSGRRARDEDDLRECLSPREYRNLVFDRACLHRQMQWLEALPAYERQQRDLDERDTGEPTHIQAGPIDSASEGAKPV